MQQCTRAFCSGAVPPTIYNLAQHTGVPVFSITQMIHKLVEAGLLVEVNWRGNSGGYYQPGRDMKSTTLKAVCDALNNSRNERYLVVSDPAVEHYQKALDSVDQLLEDSAANYTMDQLLLPSTKEIV